jgi:hypothetical protein
VLVKFASAKKHWNKSPVLKKKPPVLAGKSEMQVPRNFSHREKLRCIERELKLRIHVYPRRVHEGKMTQRQADREINVMEEIASDYVTLIRTEDAQRNHADEHGSNEVYRR